MPFRGWKAILESHNETNLRSFHQRYCICRQIDSDSENQLKNSPNY